MKIRTIAVLGAGAVGSYFLAGLTPGFGENLWVIAVVWCGVVGKRCGI